MATADPSAGSVRAPEHRADRPTGPTASTRRPLKIAWWVLRVALAAVFAGAGLSKLGGDPVMVAMFTELGAGQWMRYVVGACEVAGAVGLLVPRLVGAAAAALALLMVGATVMSLAVLQASVVSPLVLLALLLVVLGMRRSLRPAATDGRLPTT